MAAAAPGRSEREHWYLTLHEYLVEVLPIVKDPGWLDPVRDESASGIYANGLEIRYGDVELHHMKAVLMGP